MGQPDLRSRLIRHFSNGVLKVLRPPGLWFFSQEGYAGASDLQLFKRNR
jgi:hypothetical protein